MENMEERIADYVSERFGDAAITEKFRGQSIIILSNRPGAREPDTLCKFEQFMGI